MYNIIIFASGSGSNAAQIMQYAKATNNYNIALVVTNNATAGVITIARGYGIPVLVINNAYVNSEALVTHLQSFNANLIVLAGFLRQIPTLLLQAYTNKVINIHPSLLPKYGGQGMYGHYVHEAVHAAQETITGCTIHVVNEVYDEGKIIHQATVQITATDTPTTIAAKVLEQEHTTYKLVIWDYLKAL